MHNCIQAKYEMYTAIVNGAIVKMDHDVENAYRWLDTPHEMLEGLTPMESFSRGEGIRVLSLL